MNPRMNLFRNRLTRYLSDLDEQLDLKSGPSLDKLPLVVRERYRPLSVRLFGSDWLLLLEDEAWETGTPTEYSGHVALVAKVAATERVAVVLHALTATVRNRMVKMRVPFIVPETQVFLPLSMVLLKELHGAKRPTGGHLSPVAQALVLMQIERGGLSELSSKEIAPMLEYSTGAISLAVSELEDKRLCNTSRAGKSLRIAFPGETRDLWEKALPLLRTPVRKRCWVRWRMPPEFAVFAGISALSRLGNLADDAIPTMALADADYQRLVKQREHAEPVEQWDADVQLEIWRYHPRPLAKQGIADQLSLYLSLKDSPDERVQAELTGLMEQMVWR